MRWIYNNDNAALNYVMRCNVTKYLWQSIYIAPHILLTLWWTPNLAFCSNKRLLKYAGVLYCSWQGILYIAEWFLCLILAFDVLIFARLLLGLFLFFLASRLSRWVHFRIWFSCWIIQMCIIFMIESETEFAVRQHLTGVWNLVCHLQYSYIYSSYIYSSSELHAWIAFIDCLIL